MIPKKIHYCWFGGKPLPPLAKKCIDSWKKKCPDYEIVEWNETNFDIECSKFVKDAYANGAWAFVSDYARLKIIYENGGIYLDTDVEVLKNLGPLLEEKCYFAVQQDGSLVATGLGFGGEKGSIILKEMLDLYDNTVFDNDKREDIACPILNTLVLKKHGYEYSEEKIYLEDIDTTIFPPKYFDPIAPGDSKDLSCAETFSIHHYSATWTPKKTRLKRTIVNILGQKNVNKIKKIFK